MAIYQRGKNWYIDFVFKGHRIRESIGPSRKDAEKIIAKKKTEIVENKYLDIRKDPDPVKFHDFVVEYLAWRKANTKPSSFPSARCCMRRLDEVFEKKPLHEITTWQIEQYKLMRKKKVKAATLNLELVLLKNLYKKAIEWGKVKESPAKPVKLLGGLVQRDRFLMPEDIQGLLSNCADWLQPIVLTAVHTGMRRGEIINLRPGQVNLNQGVLSLPDTKSGEPQKILLDDTMMTLLNGMDLTGVYVFKKDRNRNTLRFEIDIAFKEAKNKAGIEDFHFHDLRHTAASNLIMQEGVSLYDVQKFLRHKSPSMTARYSHLAQSHQRQAIGKLDRALSMSQNPPQADKVVSISR